ncbi:MAG: T9SS C-terminal target domain-containing protein [Bacteroidetes bacterium]|nr:MAG: T9SS C-terminal target domain-containing protein [Bacteroidota bacterium]
MCMKKMLLLSLVFLTCIIAPLHSQNRALWNHPFQGGFNNPDKVLSSGDTTTHMFMPAVPSSWWFLDSTWYSSWNNNSSAWDLYEREIRTYTNNGSIKEILFLNWNDITLTWDNWARYVYNYGPSGTPQWGKIQDWDYMDNIWIDISYYHYTNQGQIDTSFYKTYNRPSNIFINGTQNIYTYNASNQLLEAIGQVLDTATSDWVNQSKTIYSYNGNYQVIQLISQTWDNGLGDWTNSTRYDYSYDGSGYATGYIEYAWNTAGSTWNNVQRATYTNDPSGNPTQRLYEIWDSGTSAWVNHDLVTYQYNANYKVTQYLDQNWNIVLQTFVNYVKETYSYYTNGNQEEYYGYLWNPFTLAYTDTYYNLNDSLGHTLEYYSKSIDWGTFQYTYGYKYIYSYNSFQQPSEILEQLLNLVSLNWYDYSRRLDTYDANQNCTVELDQQYDTVSTAWINLFKQDHFYSFTTGIREIQNLSDYCFFSNPLQAGNSIFCPNLITGKTYRINLMNVQGQTVYTTILHTGESFSVPQDISAGMYLMQIMDNEKVVASGKVIVRH